VKKLILLGGGETAYDCPFGDVDLWVTADALPKLDELDPEHTKLFCFGNDSTVAIQTALTLGIPIVSTESYATEPFPKDAIVKWYGFDYFWSPLSYMIAYALYCGYQEFSIYGFDLESQEEYYSGKPRITFWLGLARGLGVKWDIAKRSKLYRMLKDNVRDRYDRAMALRDGVTPENYALAIENHGDPYIFISGPGRESITVRNYDGNGKEVSSWHP